MNTYVDFHTDHLRNLFKYVLPIAHENKDGEDCIGSGVLVNVGGRHFIATAGHCIERNPRIMLGDYYLENSRIVAASPVRILRSEYHDTLDIGFLEVEELGQPELQPHQLCGDRIVEGMVHVVGHPVCRTELDRARREVHLTKTAFGTHLLQDEADFLEFAYPHQGVRFDEGAGRWIAGPFIECPHGFSGGGCFGVTASSSSGGIQVFGYKVLGIQYEWHGTERWVRAIPTTRWRELLTDRAGVHFPSV